MYVFVQKVYIEEMELSWVWFLRSTSDLNQYGFMCEFVPMLYIEYINTNKSCLVPQVYIECIC